MNQAARPAGAQAPRKFVPKGHDRILQRLQDSRETCTIMVAGEPRVGEIVGRDKFTISVRCKDGVHRLIYKHAIDEIELPEGF